jgi:F-type H+-transporting ATPase subunit epsilon
MAHAGSFKLEILSPEKAVYQGESTSVVAPGKLGHMEILPGHANMIAELDIGQMTVTSGAGKQTYFIAGGFAEVKKGQVRILVDVVESPKDINKDRAKKALDRAQSRLSGGNKSSEQASVDQTRALAAYKRASIRLVIAESIVLRQ